MVSGKLVVLLAGAAAAQSSVTVLNFWGAEKTLTLKGSNSGTTTYENVCAPTSSGALPPLQSSSIALSSETSSGNAPSVASSIIADPSDITLIPIPIPTGAAAPTITARAHLRRDDGDGCEPYTLIQGPETMEVHLTDPIPGALTVDGGCSWTGELTAATISCTLTTNGTALITPGVQVTSSTLNPSELSSYSFLQTVAVVTAATTAATTSGNFSGTMTSSASVTGAPTGTAAHSTGLAVHSTGLAAPMAMPTGVMAVVGGAAGLFAAALAL